MVPFSRVSSTVLIVLYTASSWSPVKVYPTSLGYSTINVSHCKHSPAPLQLCLPGHWQSCHEQLQSTEVFHPVHITTRNTLGHGHPTVTVMLALFDEPSLSPKGRSHCEQLWTSVAHTLNIPSLSDWSTYSNCMGIPLPRTVHPKKVLAPTQPSNLCPWSGHLPTHSSLFYRQWSTPSLGCTYGFNLGYWQTWNQWTRLLISIKCSGTHSHPHSHSCCCSPF